MLICDQNKPNSIRTLDLLCMNLYIFLILNLFICELRLSNKQQSSGVFATITYIETQFYIPREYGILVLLDIYFSDHVPDIFR